MTLTISLRRHAETEKSALEVSGEEVRMLSEAGRKTALALGKEIRDHSDKYGHILGSYSAKNLRARETLLYLTEMVDCCMRVSYWDIERNELSEPIVSNVMNELKNKNPDGTPRSRTERFKFYLTHDDPSGQSTKPIESACEASYFVTCVEQAFGQYAAFDRNYRIEGITSAPKQECFLHAFNPQAFEELLSGETFGFLEALEIVPQGKFYVARFRGKEMGIKTEYLQALAKRQKETNDFFDRVC